jgi:ubiquinone/menaquinone biosynthesis C-methylase UbiE
MKTSKLIKVFHFLIRLSPSLRLALIRWVYDKYATSNNSANNIFLNYGYHDNTDLSLDPKDEPNRLFIQLYNRTVCHVDLHDKNIVEVGCGQGAGGVFLLEYKNPKSYTGIDLSEKAIALCQQQNKFSNAKWLQGCADKLPLLDQCADVVINIESSHFYPSMEQFLAEVNRILKPKGYMAFADFRNELDIDALNKYFNGSGFCIIEQSDITPQVLSSLTSLSDRRKAHINSTYHRIWRRAACEWSAIKSSTIYNSFINGQQRYLCYLLQKQ